MYNQLYINICIPFFFHWDTTHVLCILFFRWDSTCVLIKYLCIKSGRYSLTAREKKNVSGHQKQNNI